MASGPQPPGEVGADAHSLIRLRERTENPQLTDVPSDLRVNGARHASRDSAPPSKPKSPPQGDTARLAVVDCNRSVGRTGRPAGALHALVNGVDHSLWMNRFFQHR